MFGVFSKKYLERVKHAWGRGTIWSGQDVRHWLQLPMVQERISSKVSGTPGVNRFEYFLQHYLCGKMPVASALTLGCGAGELERGLSKYHFALAHEGIDISDDAVRTAAEKAAEEGLKHIRYRVADLNTVTLAPGTCDVVFGVSSIHHVAKLEHLFDQVRNALKPGGYFFLDEYIGPTKFQWTDEQLREANEQLRLLPQDLTRRVTNHREFKRSVVRKGAAEFESDPSEAIRSSEIVPLLDRYFDIVEFKGYGGTLIHELLYDIAGNFREENPGSLDHLRRLFQLEDDLIASGRLGHDFAVIIATPKAG